MEKKFLKNINLVNSKSTNNLVKSNIKIENDESLND
jgi:hypothetical protein